MKTVQVVIEIPQDIYDGIKEYGITSFPLLAQIIQNGTVLPEQYGDLIDRDAIKKKYPLMYNDLGMEFNNGIHDVLDEAPTIYVG